MSDNQEIQNVVRQLESAWNASDSVAFARVFARDADFIHIIGGHYQGQEAIQEGHRQIWDTIYKDSKVVYDIEGIRQIRPDVAIAFVLSTLTYPKNPESPRLQARPTLILAKQDGTWEIVAFQNTLVGEPRPFENSAAGYPPKR